MRKPLTPRQKATVLLCILKGGTRQAAAKRAKCSRAAVQDILRVRAEPPPAVRLEYVCASCGRRFVAAASPSHHSGAPHVSARVRIGGADYCERCARRRFPRRRDNWALLAPAR